MTETILTADSPSAGDTGSLTDPAFLEDMRHQMLKFATLQLGNVHLAEDAVQEALLGALKNARSFGGKAALKTWVFAILKNKIADILRHKQRLVTASDLSAQDEDNDLVTMLFDRKGHWHHDERPQDWGDPEGAFKDAQFWQIFELCLEDLPPQQAKLFMMREFVELETAEICEATGVTISNLFVTLHRARLRLTKCLEHRWFQAE